jgi:choline-sulfatase
MAGRRVHELQTYNNSNINLSPDFPSYGCILAEQGVYSVHIGKVDVYADGEDLGFSEMLLPRNREFPGDHEIDRNPVQTRAGAAGRGSGFGIKEDPFKKDNDTVDAGIRWLNEKAGGISSPWVLSINIGNPHFPQYVSREYWDLYESWADLPSIGSEAESARHPYAEDLRRHFADDEFSEEQIRGLRRGYRGCISYVDEQWGRLMEALEANGLADDTLVIYTSDHGDMMGKFGMWWKCSLYEDSVRVPCLAAGPGIKAGRHVAAPVDLLDVQAAIFNAVGAVRPDYMKGKALQELQDDVPERPVFSEYHGHGVRGSSYMLRKGNWKLITYQRGPNQLFNLEDDPEELDNLYSRSPEKAEELEQELRNFCDTDKESERADRFIGGQLEFLGRV